MRFKDHFSNQAALYASARPHYPPALFDWLAQHAPRRGLAWDAGCGSGQCALALAAFFDRVIATEPSAAQLEHAAAHPRVEYRNEPAESPSLEPGSVDLLTVAQALHWFELERFWPAARRVLAGDALVAVWCYGYSHVDAAVDGVFARLHDHLLGPYWPPERRHIGNHYAQLSFPFEPVSTPEFAMRCDWTLAQYLAYLGSWSSVARYREAHDADPLELVRAEFATAWGDPDAVRTVRWPLTLKVGRVAEAG